MLLLLAIPSHAFFVLIIYFIDRSRWTLFTVPFAGMYMFAVFTQVRFRSFPFSIQYCTRTILLYIIIVHITSYEMYYFIQIMFYEYSVHIVH